MPEHDSLCYISHCVYLFAIFIFIPSANNNWSSILHSINIWREYFISAGNTKGRAKWIECQKWARLGSLLISNENKIISCGLVKNSILPLLGEKSPIIGNSGFGWVFFLSLLVLPCVHCTSHDDFHNYPPVIPFPISWSRNRLIFSISHVFSPSFNVALDISLKRWNSQLFKATFGANEMWRCQKFAFFSVKSTGSGI